MSTRIEEARVLAEDTLAKLEVGEGSLTPIVLRCLRLARLIGERTAEAWFQCELRGFGSHVAADKDWPEYAEWSGRYSGQDHADGYRLYWVETIEQIESRLKVAWVELDQLRAPDQPIPESASAVKYPNFLESATPTERVMKAVTSARQAKIQEINRWAKIVATARGSTHDWLSRTAIRLRYGAIVDTAFQRTKDRFDRFLGSHAPDAGRALSAAFARADSSDPEELAQSFTSCRRALKALADAIYPPRDEPLDGHELDDEHYKNRLIQFAAEHQPSKSRREYLSTEIELTAKRTDALYELSNKGVHGTVDEADFDVIVVHTYLLAGELLALLPGVGDAPPVSVPSRSEERAAEEGEGATDAGTQPMGGT